MQKAMAGTSRTLFSLSLSSSTTLFSLSRNYHYRFPFLRITKPSSRVLPGFKPLCTSTATATTEHAPPLTTSEPEQMKHEIILERLRLRHLKDSVKSAQSKSAKSTSARGDEEEKERNSSKKKKMAGSFEELGLSDEVMGAVRELGIQVPTEIQCIGIPAVLDGRSVVLGSHTGSGKTLAYMLPLVQLMRQDEASSGIVTRPRRPRAVVLCPTRELSEQVYRVAKSLSHHARFRSVMVSGGSRLKPQEDSLNSAIDLVVGTPGRVLQHIEEGNMVFGDIKYLVLDEADTMFDHGFGPEIQKFLAPLKNRASKPKGLDFQTVLVTATMTKAVQNLVNEEFQGIEHLRTSSLHKKIASARHDFIKLSGSENKMDSLLQVLEPSLTKGNRVMVFCNTLNSSRAVDHFLTENQVSTVNYHGEVPAEQRVENLKKFKSDDGDCPTLVCTDLAARGLDLDVDHVIMFDFPSNSIDYLHRTGRTARMGAKGKVTSLVAKKNLMLATRIEEAIRNNESLESLSIDNVRRDVARSKIMQESGKTTKLMANQKNKSRTSESRSSSPTFRTKTSSNSQRPERKSPASKYVKSSDTPKYSKATGSKYSKATGTKYSKATATGPRKTVKFKGTSVATKPTAGKSVKFGGTSGSKKTSARESKSKDGDSRKARTGSKLSVVGFRGRGTSTEFRGRASSARRT